MDRYKVTPSFRNGDPTFFITDKGTPICECYLEETSYKIARLLNEEEKYDYTRGRKVNKRRSVRL